MRTWTPRTAGDAGRGNTCGARRSSVPDSAPLPPPGMPPTSDERRGMSSPARGGYLIAGVDDARAHLAIVRVDPLLVVETARQCSEGAGERHAQLAHHCFGTGEVDDVQKPIQSSAPENMATNASAHARASKYCTI